MDLGYQDKVAVVTGGSSGIGLATAEQLLKENAKVVICGRNLERLQHAKDLLSRKLPNGKIYTQICDVLNQEAVYNLANFVASELGQCDLLVNNAGRGFVSTFEKTSHQDWRTELELKFFSQIYPIEAFRHMLLQSNQGAIVAVNSLLAFQPEPHMVCTSAARAGVQNLLKSLSVELAPKIRVNSILVGLIESGQWERRFESRADKNQSRENWFSELAEKRKIPMGRLGLPQEAANAIVFLGSNAARYITGTFIEVSGGLSRFV